MLPRISPINPTRIAAAFDHEDWIFELKHDGFRAVAYIEDGTCRLISRKQIQYKSFAGLCTAMAKLPVNNAILDGELVALDKDGKSQFLQLMRRKRQDVCFYAFDLIDWTVKIYVGSRSWRGRAGCGNWFAVEPVSYTLNTSLLKGRIYIR